MVRTLTIAIGVIVIFVLLQLQATPRTHVEAIGQALQAHKMTIRTIVVTQPWPNALPFYAYGAQVMPYSAMVSITLVSGVVVTGSMICHAAPHACTLTVPDFAVYSLPLADIVLRDAHPWMVQVWREISQLIDF